MSDDTTVCELPPLAQARRALAEAHAQEAAARKAWDNDRQNPATQQAMTTTQPRTRQMQGWVDQVERRAAALPGAEEEAERTLLREESEYSSLIQTDRRAEAQKARQVQQARAQRDKLRADRRAIEGDADVGLSA